jgi:hypothetical protein
VAAFTAHKGDPMNNRNVLWILVIVVLAIGGYMVYQDQQDDIEIELPDIDIDN